MILSAEKESLASEVSFYKQELAKMCMLTKKAFPVFAGAAYSPQSKLKNIGIPKLSQKETPDLLKLSNG